MNSYRFRRLISTSIAWSVTELAMLSIAVRNGWVLATHEDDVRAL